MDAFTPEMLKKARNAKSSKELTQLAKSVGLELSEESAEAYFKLLVPKSGELVDDELKNVSGGGCYSDNRLVVTVGTQKSCFVCKNCGINNNHHDTEYDIYGYQHFCGTKKSATINCCNACKYCTHEKGLWLCDNPKNYK